MALLFYGVVIIMKRQITGEGVLKLAAKLEIKFVLEMNMFASQ